MIIEGGARRNGKWFATHLQRTDQGQTVSIAEVRGLAGTDILGWFQQMEAMALGTRGDNAFYHANINPREDEELTPEQWDIAADVLEKKLGLEDQPRFIVQHEKNGRVHQHIFWSRVDADTGKMIRDSHNYDRHMGAADVLEKQFDHERTPRGRGLNGRNPENYEVFRGKKCGLAPALVQAELQDLWRQTDGAPAFAAAVAEHGYILAEGTRGLCAVDPMGKEHSLYRRLDLRKKDLDPRMESIREDLPSVEEARALARERAINHDEREDTTSRSKNADDRSYDRLSETLAGELAEAIRDAFHQKGEAAGHQRDDGPPSDAKDGAPDPDPKREDDSSVAYIDPSRSPESEAWPAADGTESRAAPDHGPPPARPGSRPEPSARSAPSAFERLAQIFSQAKEALSGGPTVAEAADLAPARAAPSRDGVPLPPWEIPPPDRSAPGSTSTPFERLASELVRDAKEVTPLLGDLAIVAAAVAERKAPSEFARLTQELTRDAAPAARALAEAKPALDAFESVVSQRRQALRESGGDGLFIAEGLDWRARQAGTPHLPEYPPEGERDAFKRVVWEKQSATRDNGGEPVTSDGQGFWRRAIALIQSAREQAMDWVNDAAQDFVGRVLRDRNAERRDNERER